MINERTHRRPWPPESCPEWCAYDQHPAVSEYDDRTHHTDALLLPLSAAEAVDDVSPHVAVEIDQHYREVEPRVQLLTTGYATDMTLEEAEQVALAILATVAAARTGGPIVLAIETQAARS